jgi:hypothetical protein
LCKVYDSFAQNHDDFKEAQEQKISDILGRMIQSFEELEKLLSNIPED